MHDIRMIRENPEAFDAALARRGAEPLAASLVALDEARRALTTRQQEVQARRNDLSKQVGQAKAAKDEDRAQALMADPSVESISSSIGVDGINPTLNQGRMLVNLKSLGSRHTLTRVLSDLTGRAGQVGGVALPLAGPAPAGG